VLVQNTDHKILIVVASVVLQLVLLRIGEDVVFTWLALFANKNVDDKKICGTWHILIDFKNTGSNEEQHRSGILEIRKAPVGYRITGGRLVDPNNKDKVTMYKWEGSDVAFSREDDNLEMTYAYKTYEEDGTKSESKSGTVILTKRDTETEFRGVFFDRKRSDPSVEYRGGTVILHRE
jgi:hypothetical protein